ncbi:hypothetical protein [Candidatus Hodgkinia cicadicola]|uniref:hypothetical protein n=1 Tax=Candidatus Hodgkinia cicadicola TaxID=573658 RepID=UPI001788B39A
MLKWKILIKDINITIMTTTKRWSELVYKINTLDVIYHNLWRIEHFKPKHHPILSDQ